MAAYHDAAIETAEKTLNPGQSMMYQFKTPEQAHKEYMSLNRALKKRLCGSKVSGALRSLEIRRTGSAVILEMEEGGMSYPVPIYSNGTGQPQKVEKAFEGCKNPEVERIITLAKEDLEEGMITKEEYESIAQQYSTEKEN